MTGKVGTRRTATPTPKRRYTSSVQATPSAAPSTADPAGRGRWSVCVRVEASTQRARAHGCPQARSPPQTGHAHTHRYTCMHTQTRAHTRSVTHVYARITHVFVCYSSHTPPPQIPPTPTTPKPPPLNRVADVTAPSPPPPPADTMEELLRDHSLLHELLVTFGRDAVRSSLYSLSSTLRDAHQNVHGKICFPTALCHVSWHQATSYVLQRALNEDVVSLIMSHFHPLPPHRDAVDAMRTELQFLHSTARALGLKLADLVRAGLGAARPSHHYSFSKVNIKHMDREELEGRYRESRQREDDFRKALGRLQNSVLLNATARCRAESVSPSHSRARVRVRACACACACVKLCHHTRVSVRSWTRACLCEREGEYVCACVCV